MKRYAAFVWIFARQMWFWNLVFTAVCLFYTVKFHAWRFAVFTGVKFTGYASSLFFEYFIEKQRFYFFRNAGLSVSKLATMYFGTDFLINLILCSATWLAMNPHSSLLTV